MIAPFPIHNKKVFEMLKNSTSIPIMRFLRRVSSFMQNWKIFSHVELMENVVLEMVTQFSICIDSIFSLVHSFRLEINYTFFTLLLEIWENCKKTGGLFVPPIILPVFFHFRNILPLLRDFFYRWKNLFRVLKGKRLRKLVECEGGHGFWERGNKTTCFFTISSLIS